jgi:hypothetical protein
VVTWGLNANGQLGNNSTTQSPVPVLVTTTGALAGKTVVSISSGVSHTVATCSDGTVAAWGANASGQLGNNSTTQSLVPVAVSATPLAAGEVYAAVVSGSSASHNLGIVNSPAAPGVATLAATNITASGATLNGIVNAAGGSAAVAFDYGPTLSYGTTVAGIPSPVTGASITAVTLSITGLASNTTYHCRVHATNAGGTTNGPDMTLTTATPPSGGTVTLNPASPVDENATLTVTFANWTGQSLPLSYAVLVDGVVVSPQSTNASPGFTGPATPGAHTLTGRVFDASGIYADTTQNFTVNTPQESWRMYYFGTTQNVGSAADTADPDGDGFSNLFEYVAGLVPTDSNSRFSLQVVAGQPGQTQIIFSPIVAGRTYTVSYKTNLTDPSWTPLTNSLSNDNGNVRTVTDLSPGIGPRFYHVEITLP